jgi:uncharacterized protein YaiL (DUF2058 family)
VSKQKLSLQEQLLKSGLVSQAKAKTVKSDKHKQTQQQRKNHVVVIDEAKELALKVHAEKVERDRELNQLRRQKEEQKQRAAQIKQLIELNRHAQDNSGVSYQFTDGGKVKTLYVADLMRKQIINGRMAIVKLGQLYEVVSADVAEKISLRDASVVIVHNEAVVTEANNTGDPYANYQIPDDLIW